MRLKLNLKLNKKLKMKLNKNRNLSLDEYLNKIKPYSRNIVIDLQNFDMWKVQLTTAINFISSKDAEEEHVMHSRMQHYNIYISWWCKWSSW